MAEPKIVGCTCDFSSGTRGMDRCSRCAGTGSRFLAIGRDGPVFFPNTRDGYDRAVAIESSPISLSEKDIPDEPSPKIDLANRLKDPDARSIPCPHCGRDVVVPAH